MVGHTAHLMTALPGTYTVSVTGTNGCTATDTVTVLQDLQAPRVQTSVDGQLSCQVSQVKLTALASNGRLPYIFEWKNPEGMVISAASEVYVSAAGTYSVRVLGANGCFAVGSVIVTETISAPIVDIRGSGPLTCAINEITLTANISGGHPPYDIEWVGPAGNLLGKDPLLVVTQPGTYFVSVTGSNGCPTSASIAIEEDAVEPRVDAGPDQWLSEEVPQVTLTPIIDCEGSYAVQWTNDLGEILSYAETIVIDQPGEYTVTAIRDTGCTASDTVAVTSEIITEVMLDSGIEGLAVFGQLTLDGVPIPESAFYFIVDSIGDASGVEVASIALRSTAGEGFKANGAEVNYIIPGNSIVTFQIHRDQFVAGKWYNLPHLPIDPPGAAAVKFF